MQWRHQLHVYTTTRPAVSTASSAAPTSTTGATESCNATTASACAMHHVLLCERKLRRSEQVVPRRAVAGELDGSGTGIYTGELHDNKPVPVAAVAAAASIATRVVLCIPTARSVADASAVSCLAIGSTVCQKTLQRRVRRRFGGPRRGVAARRQPAAGGDRPAYLLVCDIVFRHAPAARDSKHCLSDDAASYNATTRNATTCNAT